MDPELIKKGWVWDVSETLASQFEKERKVTDSLAAKCGLTKKDLGKIFEAKKKLGAFQPANHLEQMAKRALEGLLSSKPRKKVAGRPSRISAAERQELRQRADEMIAAGRKRNEIVAQFAEEYGLGFSYVRRILEDRLKQKEKS
ncbi:MAG: cytochrome c-type biogenesis protein [Candidatus Acidiferrales bacterium]